MPQPNTLAYFFNTHPKENMTENEENSQDLDL